MKALVCVCILPSRMYECNFIVYYSTSGEPVMCPSSRHLIYTGQLELGDAHRPTAVRTYVQSTCTHNLPDLLKDLGFTCVPNW